MLNSFGLNIFGVICALAIALCFSEARRKQCAICAAGGKNYDNDVQRRAGAAMGVRGLGVLIANCLRLP